MLKMKVELEEIEINVNGEETLKLLKKDQKERLRIGETIMNLLLKLDCVRVFQCYALREFRKSLIKRVIFLQEFVDQIQMVGPTYEDDIVKGNFVGVEEKEDVGCEEEQEGGVKIEVLMNEVENEGNCVGEEVNCLGNEKEDEGEGEEPERDEKMEVLIKEENEGGNKIEALMNEGKCVNEEENCLMKEKDENEEDEEGNKMEGLEKMEESVGTSLVEEGIEGDSVVVKEEEGKIVIGYEEEDCKEESDGNKGMLKRMIEDNEKMMEMMAQLFERNEKQTTLLTSLTQRVEQLERAFTCDKLRRKKKRRNVDAKYRHNACS
ncbi:uncharacterized protein [Cicer arietinum]|uniref:uncharacterized protein n=1 Tax=Cicer arietinum TaxID=3827 RepID=UPI00032A74E4